MCYEKHILAHVNWNGKRVDKVSVKGAIYIYYRFVSVLFVEKSSEFVTRYHTVLNVSNDDGTKATAAY